jgi:hypothetical protein
MNKKIGLLVIGLFLLLALGAGVFLINKTKKAPSSNDEFVGKGNAQQSLGEKETSFKSDQLKEGYAKTAELMKEENAQLKSIMFVDDQHAKNRISFVFVTDKEIVTVDYDFGSQEARLMSRSEKQAAGSEDGSEPQQIYFAKDDYPSVPEEVLNFGLDDARNILESNEDYANYKQKYPNLVASYSAILDYDRSHKWEWKYNFYEIDPQDQNNTIRSFGVAVNIGDKKSVVIGKNNVD